MECTGLREARPEEAINVEDMRAAEVNAVYHGISLDLLMENAGRAIADAVECVTGNVRGLKIAVAAGKGGNGGDAIVAARHLAERGARVEVHLSHPPELITHGSTSRNLKVLASSGYARLVKPWGKGWGDFTGADVVIDGLLGIGARGRLRDPIYTLARAVREHQGLRLSIDTPTGVDPDTGDVADGAVVADVTVTLYKPKRGLFLGNAPLYTGRILVAPIGIPPEAEKIAGPGDVARIPPRPRDAHKGMGGRVLVVGGSRWYIGAPMLAAVSAARAGVDLVYLAGPRHIAFEAASRHSTIIPVPIDNEVIRPTHVEYILEASERVHAVVVGPGAGTDKETLDALSMLIREMISRGKIVVVDADGLKAVEAGIRGLGGEHRQRVVLTPHRGEAARLLGVEHVTDPGNAARELASRLGVVVVLKGVIDYICGPSGCRLNKTGTPSMSVGGTGDVLSGVIAGFAARRAALGLRPDLVNVAAAGVYIVGRAGELAVERVGENISALDVVDYISRALAEARSLGGG